MLTVSNFLPKFNFSPKNSAKNDSNIDKNGDNCDIESLSNDLNTLRIIDQSSFAPPPPPPPPLPSGFTFRKSPNVRSVGHSELISTMNLRSSGGPLGQRSPPPPPGALPSVLRAPPPAPSMGPFPPQVGARPQQIPPPPPQPRMIGMSPFQSDKRVTGIPLSVSAAVAPQIPSPGPLAFLPGSVSQLGPLPNRVTSQSGELGNQMQRIAQQMTVSTHEMAAIPPFQSDESMSSMPVSNHQMPIVGTSAEVESKKLPRPISSSSMVMYETYQSNPVIPPPPTSEHLVKDTGSCSPRYMRCTLNQIPCTNDLLKLSSMPLSLIVQPLAVPHPSEEPIQVVDFGESGPVRCSCCKGYMNPFMKFINQGKRFICNLCSHVNETPGDYYCNLGPDGRRLDADNRPEICNGTVEFVATQEYMIRDVMPVVYFILIDVSMKAVQSGATAAACNAVKRVIADLHGGLGTMVGIATYDNSIHFYNLKHALQQPSILIVPDIQDVYTPLQTDVIANLSECCQYLDQLLENIPSMFHGNNISDSAFGAAIKAALLLMKTTGGKLLVFQSVLPSVGIGALPVRENEGKLNTSSRKKETLKLLQPAEEFLSTISIELARYKVCVDVFLTTQTYIDLASISVIPKTTGGQIYYYCPFSALLDYAKLYNDLKWNITRPQGFEAVMCVRCSKGLQVEEYSGNFYKDDPMSVDFSGIDCDKTIMVTLKHNGKVQDGSKCAFQCALVYTTVDGQRRIRVNTLSIPCTNDLMNLFLSADLETHLSYFLKQVANELPMSSPLQVRDRLTNLCINILHSYRKYCATISSFGHLVFPETLKLLPLYILALEKSTGMKDFGRIDDQSYWISRVSLLSAPLTVPLVYPRMLTIHTLLSVGGDDAPTCIPSIPLSTDFITENGIFLLENGEDALMYVGDIVDPSLLQQLFGVSFADISMQFVLQQFDNPLSKKLNDLINVIRCQRSSYLRLRFCKRGDPSEALFKSFMVEDKNAENPSYIEFLHHIHKQIQAKIS